MAEGSIYRPALTERSTDWQRLLGPALMVLNVAAATTVFWYGFESLVKAWQLPEYSHGPIIPLLSFYMYLREMKTVPPVSRPITDRWPGLVVVLVAFAIGILGLMVRIPDIVTYAFILWVGGTVLVCFGARRGWYFWPSVLHLVFMLPLPNFVYWPLSIWLQGVSSEIGVGLIAAIGIPVFLDGNIIDLGVYKLQVAEACSGLRYLFPVMSFSYVFGVLYTGPAWHKIVLLLSAAPITVLMNSFRIGVIGVMVENFGISYAEGFLHLFEGWVIFIACVAILFAMAALMQRLSSNPRPIGESIDLDFTGIGGQLARFTAIPASGALVVATALALMAAGGWYLTPSRAMVEPERDPLVLFPERLGEWSGQSRLLEPEIERVLGADDYLLVDYRSTEAPTGVNFFVAYYDKLTDGSGIHSPEVCVPTGGWEVSRWQQHEVTLASGETLSVNRAIIQKGLDRQLVYYWFEQRGRRMTSAYEAKLMTVVDSLSRGRTDGGLVRLVTPLRPGEPEAEGEKRLNAFLDLALPRLERHVPE